MRKSKKTKKPEIQDCIQYLESNLPAEEAIVIPDAIFRQIKETILWMEDEPAYKHESGKTK